MDPLQQWLVDLAASVQASPAGVGAVCISLGVVDREALGAYSAVPGASCRTGYHLDRDRGPYAIDSVDIRVGGVLVTAQAAGRPLTEEEIRSWAGAGRVAL